LEHLTIKEQNSIFKSLPLDVWERVSNKIELVDMTLGLILSRSGETQTYLYFPTTSIVAVLYELEDGTSATMALVGREGCAGVAIFMGGQSTITTHIVQIAGAGYRIKANLIQESFARAGPLMIALLKYTQSFIVQVTQTAVCNRHHSIKQQFCRYLLLLLDRLPSDEFNVTHELIAQSLGVRREGITEVAGALQKNGLIKYARGHIKVLDPEGLEKQSCECYKVVKKEYARLLC